MSKGSRQRESAVDRAIFEENFDRIFRKQSDPDYCDAHDKKLEDNVCEYCEQAKSEYTFVQ